MRSLQQEGPRMGVLIQIKSKVANNSKNHNMKFCINVNATLTEEEFIYLKYVEV